MSGHYQEPVRWTSKTKEHSATISITSVVGLIEGLHAMGCKTNLKIKELQQLESALTSMANAYDALENGQYMSLEDSQNYEQLAINAIQSSEHLQTCIEAVESIDAKEIDIVDNKGVKRTLVKMAGAYRLRWSETYQQQQGGNAVRGQNDNGGADFSRELRTANEDAQLRREKRMKQAQAQLSTQSAQLSSRLQTATSVRSKWQRIHDSKNLENFRQERASTIEERVKSKGYSTTRIVNTKEEIVIVARQRG